MCSGQHPAFYVCSESLERTVFESHTGNWETQKAETAYSPATEFTVHQEDDAGPHLLSIYCKLSTVIETFHAILYLIISSCLWGKYY